MYGGVSCKIEGVSMVMLGHFLRGILGSWAISLDHPLRYVPRSMEHAPDINVVWPLKIKDEVRITCEGPKAQTGQVQFMCITR